MIDSRKACVISKHNHIIVFLGGTLTILVVGLLVQGMWDVWRLRATFPQWFPPLFGMAVVGLLGAMAVQIFPSRRRLAVGGFLRGAAAHTTWFLLSVSWMCTTSVHQFFPFRLTAISKRLDPMDPVMLVNGLIAIGGLMATVCLWRLYVCGRQRASIIGLLIVALLALIPNDDCRNSFNFSWLQLLGVSPLMYVPNSTAALFGVGVFVGVRPYLSIAIIALICLGTLFLGLGHYLRFIW